MDLSPHDYPDDIELGLVETVRVSYDRAADAPRYRCVACGREDCVHVTDLLRTLG